MLTTNAVKGKKVKMAVESTKKDFETAAFFVSGSEMNLCGQKSDMGLQKKCKEKVVEPVSAKKVERST